MSVRPSCAVWAVRSMWCSRVFRPRAGAMHAKSFSSSTCRFISMCRARARLRVRAASRLPTWRTCACACCVTATMPWTACASICWPTAAWMSSTWTASTSPSLTRLRKKATRCSPAARGRVCTRPLWACRSYAAARCRSICTTRSSPPYKCKNSSTPWRSSSSSHLM